MSFYEMLMILAQFGRFIYDIIKDIRKRQKNNRPPVRKG